MLAGPPRTRERVVPPLLKSQRDENPRNASDVAESAKKPILPAAQDGLVLREHAERQTADDKSEETGSNFAPLLGPGGWTSSRGLNPAARAASAPAVSNGWPQSHITAESGDRSAHFGHVRIGDPQNRITIVAFTWRTR